MDKRGHIKVQSSPDFIMNGTKKKRMLSIEENSENNGNTTNSIEIDSFPYFCFDNNDCFDDENFEIEMHQEVIAINSTFGNKIIFLQF